MSVQELMSLIDENSSSFPEGEYLKMCNIMKHLHGPKNVLCVTPDFSEQEIVIDRNCIDKCYQCIMTMCYYDNVSNHYKNISKRTEVTPALKVDALVEIATAHGVTLEDYTFQNFVQRSSRLKMKRKSTRSILRGRCWRRSGRSVN